MTLQWARLGFRQAKFGSDFWFLTPGGLALKGKTDVAHGRATKESTSPIEAALAAAKARHAAAKSAWTNKQAALLTKGLGAFPGAKKIGEAAGRSVFERDVIKRIRKTLERP